MNSVNMRILYFCWLWITTANCITVRNRDVMSSSNISQTTSILDFWKQHEDQFQIEKKEDIIVLLGASGHGKTATISLLVNDELESYEFFIIDANGRINSEESFIPELRIDYESNATFYDCPSFDHSQGPQYQVAIAYFLNQLLNSANSIKLVLVVDFAWVEPDESLYFFYTMIENVIHLIKDVEKYSDGIAMVVTKVTGDYETQVDNAVWNDDAEIVDNVARFLKEMRKMLKEELDDEEYPQNERDLKTQALALTEILLKKQHDKYERIGVIRKPDETGLLDDMEEFQNEKIRLKEIIYENIEYVPKDDTEFGYPIAFRLRIHINHLINEIIQNELNIDVSNIFDEIENFYLQQEMNSIDINLLEYQLGRVYRKLIRISNVNACSFINRMIGLTEDLNINVPNVTLNRISKQFENIDFLTKVSGSTPVTPISFEQKLKATIEQINDSHKWYAFLIYLRKELDRIDRDNDDIKTAAVELKKNCLIGDTEMRNISDIGLKRFLRCINVRCYGYVDELQVNSFQLKALRSILSDLWQ